MNCVDDDNNINVDSPTESRNAAQTRRKHVESLCTVIGSVEKIWPLRRLRSKTRDM